MVDQISKLINFATNEFFGQKQNTVYPKLSSNIERKIRLRNRIHVCQFHCDIFRFARIPDINRDTLQNDNRNITILHPDHKDDLKAAFEKDKSIDFFSSSPEECQGTMNISPDNLVFYEFS